MTPWSHIDIRRVQRGHPQATQAGITDKQPDQNWDMEGFRGPENKNSNDFLNFPMQMWILWLSPLLSKVLFKTMVSIWGKFPYLEFVRAGVGDKSRDSIIKSANLIIAILLCILLRASSRYRQNRQLPMATDCWWNQREFRLLQPPLSVRVAWRASLVAVAGGIRTCGAVAFDGSSEDLRASLQLLSSSLCSPDTSAVAEVESVTLQDPPLAQLLLFCSKIQSCRHFCDVWSWLGSRESCELTVAGGSLRLPRLTSLSAPQSNGNTSTNRKKSGRCHAAAGETTQALQKCAGEDQTIFHEIMPENEGYFCAKITQTMVKK